MRKSAKEEMTEMADLDKQLEGKLEQKDCPSDDQSVPVVFCVYTLCVLTFVTS
jgi:hypothetical protein